MYICCNERELFESLQVAIPVRCIVKKSLQSTASRSVNVLDGWLCVEFGPDTRVRRILISNSLCI
jgi:hypothetical protein